MVSELVGPDQLSGIEPLPEPQSGDWLAVHDESPQSFKSWYAHFGEKSRDRTIYLQQIGKFEGRAPHPDLLAEYVSIYFGVNVESLPAIPLEDLKVTQRTREPYGNVQILSTDVLEELKRRKAADTDTLMGITMSDLYPRESWNFVFGQASLVNGVGIMSFNRFDPDNVFSNEPKPGETAEQAILRRSLKLLTHELGHTFGVSHCTHFHCMMNGSNNLSETDRSPLHICPIDLQKIQFAVGFDARERYLRLGDWYERNGFPEQADFARARAAELDE